jgi:hypothetical protein
MRFSAPTGSDRPELGTFGYELGHRQALETTMELFRGGEAEVAYLSNRLDPGAACRTLGHHEHPDGLDGAVLGLSRTRGPTREGSSSGFDRIKRIGLAMIASGLTVGAIDLHDLDAPSTQEASHPDPIGTGPFDSDLGHLAEPFEPTPDRASGATRGARQYPYRGFAVRRPDR